MDSSLDEVLKDILNVRELLHGAGTVSKAVLTAIARHARARKIHRSVETGCGVTTLLLSHLSEQHTVFALDIGGSLANVRRSHLLREENVRFVEGPSQRTLSRHEFDQKVQLALIDGPHAYPFPDLEYYFLYPHLEVGALLVLDDIHIRTIHHLFEFLRCEEMFRLDEVIGQTAFFTRTDAAAFDPIGDDWQRQKYNERTLLRYSWRSRLGQALPRSLRFALRNRTERSESNCSVEILFPRRNQRVGRSGLVEGRAALRPDSYLWVLARRKDQPGWWPQGQGPAAVVDGNWSVEVNYGEVRDAGFQFEIAAIIAGREVHESWLAWVGDAGRTGLASPVSIPTPPKVRGQQFQTVRKSVS
jgi:hypothetical protein